MTNQYARGRRIEQTIVKFLNDNGYKATRSAGSKGAFDVIAFSPNVIRFIQSKYTDDPKRSFAGEIRKIIEAKVPDCATKELWIYVKDKGFAEVHFISKPKNVVIPKKVRVIIHEP